MLSFFSPVEEYVTADFAWAEPEILDLLPCFIRCEVEMAEVISERMSAEIEGDFVVFLIGMRINKPWKLHKWIPVFLAMPRMLKELDRQPESGFLGSISGGFMIAQYWRSFEHLEAYARSHDHLHWPAWVAFNQRMRESRGDVGIWHETYQIRAGQYEAIYSGMPRWGLGKAGTLLPAAGRRESARGRIVKDGAGDSSAPVVTTEN